MREQIQQISVRIKELREILDIPITEMAKLLGIPIKEYTDYEECVRDIPISILYEIAHILKVDMTELLIGDSPRMASHTIVRRGGGINVDRFEGYSYESLAYNFIRRTMEPLLVELSPDVEPPAAVMHAGQEFNYVLCGTVKIKHGKHEYILNQGDSIYFDPQLPHSQTAVGDKAAFLTVICE